MVPSIAIKAHTYRIKNIDDMLYGC